MESSKYMCRQSKMLWPIINKNKTKKLLVANRDELGRRIQILTGHNYFNRHENLIDYKVKKEHAEYARRKKNHQNTCY